MEGLIISGNDVAEYIDVAGASCPGNRRINYFYKRSFRIY
jgi:hypothetical protein